MAGIGTVCVDADHFKINDLGQLEILFAGNPDEKDWPYECDVGDHNALHYQTEQGLWVAPPTDADYIPTDVNDDGTDRTFASDGDTINLQTLTAAIANISDCHPAVGVWTTRVRIDATMPGSSGANKEIDIYIEFDHGDGAGFGPTEHLGHWENPATGPVQWQQYWTVARNIPTVALTPGGTANIKAKLTAVGSSGVTIHDNALGFDTWVITQAGF